MTHKPYCFLSLLHGARGKNEVWWPQPTMPCLLVVQIKIPLNHESLEVSDIDS